MALSKNTITSFSSDYMSSSALWSMITSSSSSWCRSSTEVLPSEKSQSPVHTQWGPRRPIPPRVALERERETRRSLEALYPGQSFPKVRPRFLRNPATGRNLELDAYCDALKLGVEHQGEHHAHFPNAFHQTQDQFIQQQQRDQLKADLCEKSGVHLIRVPHDIPIEKIQTWLATQLPPQQSSSSPDLTHANP